MKSLLVSTVALLLVACSSAKVEQKVDSAKSDVVEQKTVVEAAPAPAAKIDKTYVYPGPSFLILLKTKADVFKLTDAQKVTFDDRLKSTQPKVKKLAMALMGLEKEIKMLSIEKKPGGEILSKATEAVALRKEIAGLKSECHTFVKTTLNDEQWNQLVKLYPTASPFNERPQKGERVAHINPLPNYMKVIKRGDVTLTDAQKGIFATWSETNSPKIVEFGAKIIELEKKVYENSLAGDESTIPTLVDEIGMLRVQVITLKTNCRDLLIAQLDDKQWATVVAGIDE